MISFVAGTKQHVTLSYTVITFVLFNLTRIWDITILKVNLCNCLRPICKRLNKQSPGRRSSDALHFLIFGDLKPFLAFDFPDVVMATLQDKNYVLALYLPVVRVVYHLF